MIDGLKQILADTKQPGVAELRRYLAEWFAAEEGTGRVVDVTKLFRSRVFRVTIEQNGLYRTLVIKRLSPKHGQLERRLVERWLPNLGLKENGPPLIGSAAQKSGLCIWHLYDYLGSWTLDKHLDESDYILAAVRLIAELHRRSAKHSSLVECRESGVDYGFHFYESNIRDSTTVLKSLKSNNRELSPKNRILVDKTLERMHYLWNQRGFRNEAICEFGGPEFILHGDLGTDNIFVIPEDTLSVKLIDWNHLGVGQAAYDLSTLLVKLPPGIRNEVIEKYNKGLEPLNYALPPAEGLNLLCETAEYARLANATLWAAIDAREDKTEWRFEELRRVDQWFEDLKPVLLADENHRENLAD